MPVCVCEGLRGAVSFALSLHLNLESHETRQVLVTTTLIIVIFTILFLGGSTMPLMKVSVLTDFNIYQLIYYQRPRSGECGVLTL